MFEKRFPNVINYAPPRNDYFKGYRANSSTNFNYPEMPPVYEKGGRLSDNRKVNKLEKKPPKTIIREILEPVYFNDSPSNNEINFVSKIYYQIFLLKYFISKDHTAF